MAVKKKLKAPKFLRFCSKCKQIPIQYSALFRNTWLEQTYWVCGTCKKTGKPCSDWLQAVAAWNKINE